ncbi:MAG TPA: helix-turn-helix transcriptional regulator [Streptosporangiaceae bacterium]|nr:helix-turn-helix transcriptional regulator [Streptosporangiaceae bacterium]
MLGSDQDLVFAMTQQALAASWSGDDEAALLHGERAVRTAGEVPEWWSALAQYVWGIALINAGRLDEGAEAVTAAFRGSGASRLDLSTMLAGCEVMAHVEAVRGRRDEAARWAGRARKLTHPDLEITSGPAELARAHALQPEDPDGAAEHARRAAEVFAAAESRIDAGRAMLRAGLCHADAGDRALARERLRAAEQVFAACDARSLRALARREQRRLVRVRPANGRGRNIVRYGLSPRELEVATLAGDGHTNQQIADRLYLSISTVETHMTRIFAKLGVTSRVGMVNVLLRRDGSGDTQAGPSGAN